MLLPEVETSAISTLAELNESFWAWLELVYHRKVHSETGQSPLERYQAGIASVRQADPEVLRKAFLWREKRKVRKDGRIELQGNTYRVDPRFVSRQIELRFDPFDLSTLEVWMDGNCFGTANVVQQGREKHIAVERLIRQARSPLLPPNPRPPSTISPCCGLSTSSSNASKPDLYVSPITPGEKMSFQTFYGFTRTPFAKDIPPADLFSAEGQNELCARLTI